MKVENASERQKLNHLRLDLAACAGSFKMSLTSTWVRAVGRAVLDGMRACGELLNVENVENV